MPQEPSVGRKAHHSLARKHRNKRSYHFVEDIGKASPALDGASAGIERALAALPGPRVPPRVWLDIGTSYKTLTKWDILHNDTLVVVGVDPVEKNVQHAYQPATPRFVRVNGACSEGPPGVATFYLHKSPTCGSLLPTRADAPKLGQGSDACTGDTPTPTQVPTFPLRLLLRRMQKLAPRVELLKIDVQGAELACLRSGGVDLGRVDNVLLEVQDAEPKSGLVTYENSPSIAELDAFLLTHGLTRQYCEWNIWAKNVREVNCLYSSSHAAARRLWATGNFQHGGSMVSYAALPSRFVRPPHFVRQLRTSAYPGARLNHPTWGGRAPFVSPLQEPDVPPSKTTK